MVSTRKKDYGSPLPKLPKKRARSSTSEGKPNSSHADNRHEKSQDVQKPEVPATVFTLFRQLPCELRVMIWKASMTSRLVVAKPRGNAIHPTWLGNIVPAQLSVNMESRECALDRYNLRFTITLTVDTTGRHRWSSPNFEGVKYYANIVMSRNDTLGLLGWESLGLGPHCHGYKFKVKKANLAKCFGIQEIAQPCGAQTGVKKVAFLTPDFDHNPKIIDILNSTVSWDMSSMLHREPTKFTRLHPPQGTWYVRGGRASHEYVWIHSLAFSGNLQQWGRRLFHRARRNGFDISPGPDILAFELVDSSEKPAAFPHPSYPVRYARFNPLGFYLTREWEWRLTHPCPRGF